MSKMLAVPEENIKLLEQCRRDLWNLFDSGFENVLTLSEITIKIWKIANTRYKEVNEYVKEYNPAHDSV